MPDVQINSDVSTARFIWREYDAVRLNEIINHPEVRPWIADESLGYLDLSAAVENRNNVLLMGEFGGCFGIRLMPGIYEVHTQILPEGRGEWALEFVKAASHWIFTHSDAWEVITRVSHGHYAAKGLTRAAGMKYEFTRENGHIFHGKVAPVDIYAFRVQEWATFAPGLVERGEWLHRRFHEEAERLGITTPLHDDDPNHNRFAGAAMEMAFGGQVRKAVEFYNRWALCARHPTIALVQDSPPVIRFDLGLLALKDGDVEVINGRNN